MKEKIKKILVIINKNKMILFVVLIGIGLFYWYEWRPIQIRKECLKVMGENPNFANKGKSGAYKACLIQNGLER